MIFTFYVLRFTFYVLRSRESSVSNPRQPQPRPLTDLIGATFLIYRRNFGVLLLIAAAVYVPALFVHIQLEAWLYERLYEIRGMGPFTTNAATGLLVWLVLGLVHALFAGSLRDCGLVSAAGQLFRGQPTSFWAAFRAGLGALPALVLAAFVTGLLGTLVLSFPAQIVLLITHAMVKGIGFLLCFGVIALLLSAGLLVLYARLALTAPAVILERLGPLAGLSRSWQLTRGALGRTLLMVALLACVSALSTWALSKLIYMLIYMLIPLRLVARLSGFTRSLLDYLPGVFAVPLGGIAYTLLYYDQRSRSEGHDLELQLEAAGYEQAP